jgi:hypothetical protein
MTILKLSVSSLSIWKTGFVASFLAAIVYQGNSHRNNLFGISYQLRNIYSICSCCWNIIAYKLDVLSCSNVSLSTSRRSWNITDLFFFISSSVGWIGNYLNKKIKKEHLQNVYSETWTLRTVLVSFHFSWEASAYTF